MPVTKRQASKAVNHKTMIMAMEAKMKYLRVVESQISKGNIIDKN